MNKIALAASLAFALIFTFNACGCDGNNNSNTEKSSSSGKNEQSSSSISSCKASGLAKVSSCDIKDYRTVVIGEQTWMAENFNCEVEGKCYGDDPVCCNIYGRLYDWTTATVICPPGWHLPSKAEWIDLYRTVGSTLYGGYHEADIFGGYKEAGTHLRAKSWNSGQDTYDFSALPGGYIGSYDYSTVGSYGHWWSFSETGNSNAVSFSMHGGSEAYWYGYADKLHLLSVRCVQD